MNYHPDKSYIFERRVRPSWKKPLFLIIVAVTLYLWGSSFFVDLFSAATYPLQRLMGETSLNFQDAIKEKKNLLAENKKLIEENERLSVQAQKTQELEGENLALRGFRESSANEANDIYARVLIRPNQLPYDEIIIDIGRQTAPNLLPGSLVFAEPGIILGQIEAVEQQSSRVKLYSTGGASLPVSVGAMGNPSVALGLGAGNFSLSLPRGVEVKVGDPVKTTIVGDYVLGYVANIVKNENDPFQKIQFRSPYNIFNLEWVMLRQ